MSTSTVSKHFLTCSCNRNWSQILILRQRRDSRKAGRRDQLIRLSQRHRCPPQLQPLPQDSPKLQAHLPSPPTPQSPTVQTLPTRERSTLSISNTWCWSLCHPERQRWGLYRYLTCLLHQTDVINVSLLLLFILGVGIKNKLLEISINLGLYDFHDVENKNELRNLVIKTEFTV